jgi:RNA ligase (TIGR02306 family)
MARKLASIQKVKALTPIEGADAIETATILGWQVVTKKGELKVGDLCIYCEIDSQLPEKETFEFLRQRKFVIRTVRLRGQISQGICFPLSLLPSHISIEEGLDVTDILEITKYEPPISAGLGGKVKGYFPGFIPKTDETRVQVLEEVINQHRGKVFYASEKIDGASMTCYLNEGVFGVCSRALDLVESNDSLYWVCAKKFDLENKLKSLEGDFALQGELAGEKIQGNRLKLKGLHFFVFNIFDIKAHRFLDYKDFHQLASKLNLEIVPIIEKNFLLTQETKISDLVNYSIGKSLLNKDVWREGVVFRPLNETRDNYLGRLSFKAINPEYLLKYGD